MIEKIIGVRRLRTVSPVLGVLSQETGVAQLSNLALNLAARHSKFARECFDRRKAPAVFTGKARESAVEKFGRCANVRTLEKLLQDPNPGEYPVRIKHIAHGRQFLLVSMIQVLVDNTAYTSTVRLGLHRSLALSVIQAPVEITVPGAGWGK